MAESPRGKGRVPGDRRRRAGDAASGWLDTSPRVLAGGGSPPRVPGDVGGQLPALGGTGSIPGTGQR